MRRFLSNDDTVAAMITRWELLAFKPNQVGLTESLPSPPLASRLFPSFVSPPSRSSPLSVSFSILRADIDHVVEQSSSLRAGSP